ncbi:MAG: pyridoxal phosphate-dependent aminotransferase, partial [Deltaproteobacteria bacterium]|nr:pyridoxal phosphate-dependent aminotransferase [Deltaproteobacteria bacterium]
VTARAKELKAEGADIISFSAGEPDFDTPKEIKRAAIQAIEAGHTKYTPVGGINELKDAIIEKLKIDHNIAYTREEILVSCGGKHSFYNLCQALLNPGDEVIVPSPYWVSYPPMIQLADGEAKILTTTEATGFKVTPKSFKDAIGERTRAIVINSPSNPTGAAYTSSEIAEIAKVAVENEVLIISDEIYENIYYGDDKIVSAASISEEAKAITIVLNGVSKAYSMTGWRIGYAAGPKELISAMTRVQSQSTSNPASVSQWASVEALKGPKDKIDKMTKLFKSRRDLMVSGLNDIEGIKCLVPDGAFYVFADVSELYGKKFEGNTINNSIELSKFLLESAGVAVVPGSAFGDDDHVRLSYACGDDDIKNGINKIKEAVSRLS